MKKVSIFRNRDLARKNKAIQVRLDGLLKKISELKHEINLRQAEKKKMKKRMRNLTRKFQKLKL